MPVIFGREIPTKTLWIGGGLIAAAVAVVVWLRARSAASAAAADTGAAQPDQGYQGAMSIPTATQAQADQYQQQLANQQIQANDIANKYQQQLMSQQARQFEFGFSQEQALAPFYQKEQAAELQEQTHVQQDLLKARIACPGGQGVALSPGGPGLPPKGEPYCREKTSGSFLGIPLGGAARIVQGLFEGAQAAAPTIGYQASQQAASFELGRLFSTRPAQGNIGPSGSQPVNVPSTPGIAPTPLPNTPLFAATPPGLPSSSFQMSGGAIGYENLS